MKIPIFTESPEDGTSLFTDSSRSDPRAKVLNPPPHSHLEVIYSLREAGDHVFCVLLFCGSEPGFNGGTKHGQDIHTFKRTV